jgi:hypothetical protein
MFQSEAASICHFYSLKVMDSRPKYAHVLIAGYILPDVSAVSLGVGHFAKDAAVGTQKALYG